MATKSTRSTRTSKTKAEVKEDFEEVAAKVKSVEALPAKEAELRASHESSIRKQVEDISPEAITRKVSEAQFAINRTLASVQEQLVQQTQELDAIKQAKKLLQADVEQLHGTDKVLLALDVLVQEYEDKERDLSEAHQGRLFALNDESSTARRQWAEEVQAHTKAVNERNAELEKTRKRELADFEYAQLQARKLQADKFAEECRVTQAAERDRHETLQRSWDLREAELKAKEAEFAALKAQVEAHPAKLDGEVKKAEAIVGNAMKRDYEHRIQLSNKDAESHQKVLEMQITALQDAVAKAQASNAELQARLKDSENNVKSIAEKALESASSSRTLSEMRIMSPHENNQGQRSKA